MIDLITFIVWESSTSWLLRHWYSKMPLLHFYVLSAFCYLKMAIVTLAVSLSPVLILTYVILFLRRSSGCTNSSCKQLCQVRMRSIESIEQILDVIWSLITRCIIEFVLSSLVEQEGAIVLDQEKFHLGEDGLQCNLESHLGLDKLVNIQLFCCTFQTKLSKSPLLLASNTETATECRPEALSSAELCYLPFSCFSFDAITPFWVSEEDASEQE